MRPHDRTAAVLLPGGFDDARGLTVDAAGNVYVANTGSDSVVEYPVKGSPIVVGGFHGPEGIALGPHGSLYVADTGANRVVRIAGGINGTTQVMPTPKGGYSSPKGISVDSAGDIFVADTGNNTVWKIAAATSPRATPSATPAAIATPNAPEDVAVDAGDNVYVTNSAPTSVPPPAYGATVYAAPSYSPLPIIFAKDKAGNQVWLTSRATGIAVDSTTSASSPSPWVYVAVPVLHYVALAHEQHPCPKASTCYYQWSATRLLDNGLASPRGVAVLPGCGGAYKPSQGPACNLYVSDLAALRSGAVIEQSAQNTTGNSNPGPVTIVAVSTLSIAGIAANAHSVAFTDP
ncbi:MAG: NHL repeat-containing protein, partial [Candidatus Eremiobacteraeota bacterium]|nr:NHL repeat-containing protein [Candidatus Eremiobacteraeota bacterium]